MYFIIDTFLYSRLDCDRQHTTTHGNLLLSCLCSDIQVYAPTFYRSIKVRTYMIIQTNKQTEVSPQVLTLFFNMVLYSVKKLLFFSTNPTDPFFVLSFFWCSSTTLEQTYDYRYVKGMFHALTYLFLVYIYMLSYIFHMNMRCYSIYL